MHVLIRVTTLCCLMIPGLAMAAETVLVGGATGRQGNAVVDELLARGYEVRGMTRRPEGRKGKRLAEKDIEIVQGNYEDYDSLLAAMDGVDKVFFYMGFSRNQLEQGKNVIAAAKASGVKHLIYSSGAAAEPGKGVPDAEQTKIELAIVDSGIPYTVFRPVAFYENFDRQQKRIAENGIVESRSPDRILHFIAIRDIGFLVGEAFDNPDEWLGQAVNIAGDKMTVRAYVDTFSQVMGREIAYTRLPLDEYLEGVPAMLRPLFRWYDEVGYEADVEGFRARYPDLITLDEYLRATGWESWRPDD
ncbi:MAG: NmrA/HSCARG family protein [Gammaproteobacteria bacterium]